MAAASTHGAAAPALHAPLAHGNIRGSALLLAGRCLSRFGNFAVQWMIVRHLTMADYGAFAYALATVQIGQTVAACGLDRAVTRFAPIYHERGDHGRLFGTFILAAGVMGGTGLLIATALLVVSPAQEPAAAALLAVLAFVIPLQAIDELMGSAFAVFAHPRAIFFRRHVLAPGLRLAVVGAAIAFDQPVMFIAAGYLGATLAGTLWYAWALRTLLQRERLWPHFELRRVMLPWREITAFTLPLLASDLVFIASTAVVVYGLEQHRGLAAVGAVRAQQSLAALNQLVMTSFATLYTPLASRLFARNDRAAINELYWQIGFWIAVLTFPVFVLTFAAAEPVTRLVLGEPYRASAPVLSVLALAMYFDAALGFNGLTLKIYGRLRYVAVICLITVAVSVAAGSLLIPRFGIIGAAITLFLSTVTHGLLKHAGLRLDTGIALFPRRYRAGYASLALTAAAVLLFEQLFDPSLAVSLAVAMTAAWLVMRWNRGLLAVADTFPELRRHALVRRVLGV